MLVLDSGRWAFFSLDSGRLERTEAVFVLLRKGWTFGSRLRGGALGKLESFQLFFSFI